ncbi:hypothetical protein A3J43_01750 [Candidatus Uhrbacteria bacterium RIFCSPHIGHO2_12_FULL_54_23]|uniref:Uncharacterized protein n=1 Tax=Candidatus Uhrbacteria bacterium RIFCSPHIGHO2_12_FULL_54_23 TaxID=1802397 RepID=A0A1F7UKC8_9BACT|nr:MAG: hypothetical protein A3J43_01750 [Candidatus Uhrbacteria bacterium RIFCSPHIGHO2_12_FULL_54_23]
MTKPKDLLLEKSQKVISSSEFLRSYNESIPAAFPPATAAALEEFATMNGRLFSARGAWSLEKHRKRLMDWLPSYQNRHGA